MERAGQQRCPAFLFRKSLNARCNFPEVFGQPSNDFSAVCFVLDAVDTSQRCWATPIRSCDGFHPGRWNSLAFIREHNLDAIWKTREVNFQMRMLEGQMFESFLASCNDSRLQSSDGSVLEACRIGQMVRHASSCGCQAHVGIDEQVQVLEFSGHGR